MKYSGGRAGRIFVVRFDEGDDILSGLESLCDKEKISAASFNMLGALGDQRLVVGSKTLRGKNAPDWALAAGEWEILGFGTVFRQNGRPKLHLHVATGKKSRTFVGCLRGVKKTHITVECVVTEILGASAVKAARADGVSLIKFGRKK